MNLEKELLFFANAYHVTFGMTIKIICIIAPLELDSANTSCRVDLFF
jgi:hypothetical protein